MKILIVYAHPSRSSLNHFLKEVAIQTLTETGHEVKVSDLYKMKFKAVADEMDFTQLNRPENFNYLREQYYANQNKTFTEDILIEQENIQWADFILFQYPLWWTEPPAILKGWFDRVFSYGFAYGPGNYENGNLKGRKALLSFTHGASNLGNYGEFGIKGRLEERLFNIQHEKLFYTGMDVLSPFIFSAGAEESEKQRQIEQYKEKLRELEKEEPLFFYPSTHYKQSSLVNE